MLGNVIGLLAMELQCSLFARGTDHGFHHPWHAALCHGSDAIVCLSTGDRAGNQDIEAGLSSLVAL